MLSVWQKAMTLNGGNVHDFRILENNRRRSEATRGHKSRSRARLQFTMPPPSKPTGKPTARWNQGNFLILRNRLEAGGDLKDKGERLLDKG